MSTATPHDHGPTPDAGVRTARPVDASAIGAVHAAAWVADYAALLPRRAASVDAASLSSSWQQAIEAPPSRQHRVMVATAGPEVVGFVAFGPSSDADAAAPGVDEPDAEIVTLLVLPAARRTGHGSRLLNATVDTLRENGFGLVRTWVPEPDKERVDFLRAAGFAPDGAARVLDAGDGASTVRELRLSARIDDQR